MKTSAPPIFFLAAAIVFAVVQLPGNSIEAAARPSTNGSTGPIATDTPTSSPSATPVNTPCDAAALDPTFDGDGKVTTAVLSSDDIAYSVAIQSDGKIVAAGFSYNGSDYDFALVRYNTDGSLDTSFDGDGKVTTAVLSGNDGAYSLAIQADGKIVAAGSSSNDFALVRYNPDGSLDTSFDGDGKVTTDVLGGDDPASSVAIQADGKIVVAGSSWSGAAHGHLFALVRYNADGSLDTSFDGDGKVTTLVLNNEDEGNSVAVQPDGKIVAAGSGFEGSNSDLVYFRRFAVVRYNADGSLDSSFDGDGIVTTVLGSQDNALSVALQADGKIVAAGNSLNGNSSFALVRFGIDCATTPTPTPTFMPANTPTAIGTGSPSASATCTPGNVVGNGGFETGTFLPWVIDGTRDAPAISTARVHTGSFSALAGNTIGREPEGDSSFYQQITVPAVSTTLSFWHWDYTTDIISYDWQDAYITDTSGTILQTILHQCANGNTWTQQTVNMAAYAGQTVRIKFLVHQDGFGDDTGMYVDDVELNDASCGTPTATATATATNTPTGTPTPRVWAVTVGTDPDGRSYTLDGSTHTTTGVYGFFENSEHSISTTTPQYSGSDTRFLWTSWSDGGDLSHSFIWAGGGGNILAHFTAQYLLTMTSDPMYGTTMPDSGFIDAGGAVQISAIPNQGFHFVTWIGQGLGSYSGPNNPASITVNSPVSEQAVFGADVPTPTATATNTPTASPTATGTATSTPTATPSPASYYDLTISQTASPDPVHVDQDLIYTMYVVNIPRYGVTNSGGFACPNVRFGYPAGVPFIFVSATGTNGYVGAAEADAIRFEHGCVSSLGGKARFAMLTIVIRPLASGTLTSLGSSVVVDPENYYYEYDEYDNTAQTITTNVVARPRADFDGDDRTDISVYRPSEGNWYWQGSTAGFNAVHFGQPTDIPASADFDNDGKTDLSVFRPSNGYWYRLNSSDGTFHFVNFGLDGDIPKACDYDSDGVLDQAVFRPSNGTWYWLRSIDGQFAGMQFGQNGDKPVVGDYDGDGKMDLAVYRGGIWYRINSLNGLLSAEQFGLDTDIPTPIDYDGDGQDDISVFRPSDGNWYFHNSGDGQFTGFHWGQNGDIPVPGDYDGDGRADVAVFREGTWFIHGTSINIDPYPFGLSGDTPIPKMYVR